MKVAFISILSNLEIRTEINSNSYAGMELIKAGANIRGYQDRQFMNSIGTFTFRGFMNKPCLYMNEEMAPEGSRLSQMTEGMIRVRGVVEYILLSLWLVKDNAVNADLIVSRSEDGHIIENKAKTTLSTSDGEFGSTQFSEQELKDSQRWFSLLGETAFGNGVEKRGMPGETTAFFHYIESDKLSPYHRADRFQRMLRFIALARSQSSLFAKITFYISALEAALSTSSSESDVQVTDSASRVLGNDSDERLQLTRIISTAYAFRSTYIHGSVHDQENFKNKMVPFESAAELADGMDSILRKMTKDFLTELNHVPALPEEEFSVWIKGFPG
ncbi:HEPN domain-containing protein [Planococcus lenghuensis]|uniref:Uncharacterized protein n=1 Tax=Planococcus lenghuensis TaxID=2213202 RepID=A0A1Q2KXE0_9BACL|nr:HEPN domain-containing protein [Planococcus lenghuensis]AQQ52860.1 hypothetical protein B0X71_07000 [Planococcus lenghuensis]